MKARLLLLAIMMFGAVAWGNQTVATYEVPVSNVSLKPYSTFDLPDFQRSTNRDDQVQISFTLPQALTGTPQKVIFMGSPGDSNPSMLTGANGTMYCSPKSCTVNNYQNLKTNLNSIGQYLRSTATSSVEFNSRMQVAEMFSGDPGGILYFSN